MAAGRTRSTRKLRAWIVEQVRCCARDPACPQPECTYTHTHTHGPCDVLLSASVEAALAVDDALSCACCLCGRDRISRQEKRVLFNEPQIHDSLRKSSSDLSRDSSASVVNCNVCACSNV